MDSPALTSATLRVQAEHIAAKAAEPHIGHPSHLENPDILQLLLAAVSDGVSYESACKSAGIAPRTIYNWKTRAEAGYERAILFVQALEKTEADVERKAVRNTLKAGEKEAFWAANMTYLERRYPERWGRRQDEGSTPKVIVQLGVSADRVQVNVLSPPTFAPDALSQGTVTD